MAQVTGTSGLGPLVAIGLSCYGRRAYAGVVTFRVKRIYDEASPEDGFRVLVDRLWPRGVTKERAALDLWAKEVAPSNDLRTWFHAHEDDVDGFEQRYRAELDANSEEVDRLRDLAAPVVTLLHSSRDEQRSNAHVLADYLTESNGG